MEALRAVVRSTPMNASAMKPTPVKAEKQSGQGYYVHHVFLRQWFLPHFDADDHSAGWINFWSSRRITLNRMMTRMILKEPLVEPEQPPTIMMTTIMILR